MLYQLYYSLPFLALISSSSLYLKLQPGLLLKVITFPDPSLGRQIHRSLDPGGEILLRPQAEYPEPNCHHALWTTHRH